MKYTSKTIEQIITSPAAKRGLDYITPIYGEAYTALWLMQAIGLQTDLFIKWIEEYKKQILPQSADWGLNYFEEEYNIPLNNALTIEQRRKNVILAMTARAPMNPAKLAYILSLATEGEINIRENTNKNTFCIEIEGTLKTEALKKIKSLTDKYKPAHLIYWLNSVMKIDFFNKNYFFVRKLTLSAYFLNLGLEILYLDGKWSLNGTNRFCILTKTSELTGLKLKSCICGNKESLSGRLVTDCMWKLDGKYFLDSNRKLNAEIKEFDL